MLKYFRFFSMILSIAIVFPQDYKSLLEKGNLELSSGHISEAEITYNSILKNNPNYAPAYHALSKLNLYKGDALEANKYANQALTLDPGYESWALKVYGIGKQLQNANKNAQQGLYEDAIIEYGAISDVFPYFSGAEFYKGLIRFKQKNIEEAGKHFSYALKIYPEHKKARKGLNNVKKQLVNLGNKYYQSGDYEQAIYLYQKSIEFDQNFHIPYYQLGVIYRKLDQSEKAMEYLNKVLEINPSHYRTWHALGFIYELNDKLNTAINHYNKALQINPYYYKSSANIASCYTKLGEYRKAEQYIANCISTFPDTTNAEAMITLYTRLANIYEYQDYFSKAKSSLYKALEYGSLDKAGWGFLALVHNQLGEWHNAKDAAEKSLGLDQNHSQGLAELGAAYEGLEDYDNAIKYYNRLLGNNTWDDWVRDKILYVHIANDNSNYALDMFFKNTQDQNKDSKYYYRLGSLYYRSQEYDEAIRQFIRALELSDNKEDKATYNYWVGFAYKEIGILDEAIKYFENSFALNPNVPETLWQVYKAYKSIGKYESAFNIIERLKVVDPQNSHTDIEYDLMGKKIGMIKDEIVSQKPKRLPPKLVIHNLEFVEPSGNSALDSEENGYIEFTLKNEGRGAAYGLSIKINTIEGLFINIDKKRIKKLQELSPGLEENFKVHITGDKNIINQTCNIRIEVLEEFGFDSDPVEINFQTIKKALPTIKLAALSIDDTEGENSSGNGNTIIEAGEYVVATVFIQNHSPFDAKDLKVKFIKPETEKYVHLTQLDSVISLQKISSGDFSKINFDFSVTPRFEKQGKTDIPINMQLFYENKSLKTIDLGLKLKNRNNSVSSVNISKIEVNQDVLLKEITELKPVDVDINIPKLNNANIHAIAVIIGIEHYKVKEVPRVDYAENDATIFYKYAKNILGINNNRIKLIKNDDATLGAIKSLFGNDNWIDIRVNNKDETDLYIFFAGHGYGKTNDDGITKGYLIPSDIDPKYPKTGISIDNMYSDLASLDLRSTTVFLDACFSGLDRQSNSIVKGLRPITLEVDMSYETNVTVFSASTSTQVSGSFPDKKHGLFTYFLLKGLRPENWKNNASSISVGDLFQYIENNVLLEAGNLDRRQRPTLTTIDRNRIFITY